MRVLDGAVACFDGVAGVEPQSETVWRQAEKYNVPRMCFVNKLDRTGANFEMCVGMIKDRLGARPAVLYLPIGIESEFKGLVDLVENRAIIWLEESLGAKFEYQEIPDDLKDAAAAARMELIEMAVEQDDDIMEAYLGGDEPDVATLKALIRKGTLNFSFVPVLCGSAFKNKGVQPLLDAVVDYLPSPLDVPAIQGLKLDGVTVDERPADDNAPFAALAFKIMNDPFVGTLTFARIYSGKLETASQVTNSVKDKKEKVGRMLLMHANDREDIQVAYAGDIVALAGLKDTTTGDTLCASNAPIILERMEFPEPVIELSGRAEDQGRPGEDGHRAQSPVARGSVVPRVLGHRERPDHHQGDGRAPPRDPGRPHEARVQGRGQCRRAAGRLSRISRAGRSS